MSLKFRTRLGNTVTHCHKNKNKRLRVWEVVQCLLSHRRSPEFYPHQTLPKGKENGKEEAYTSQKSSDQQAQEYNIQANQETLLRLLFYEELEK